jgi:ABC-type polysaccharide/polyol phosphate export permease
MLSGIHSYRFENSAVTPGSTRFVNEEEFLRLSNVVMRIMPVEKMFYQFCEEFKARVESLQEEGLVGEVAA